MMGCQYCDFCLQDGDGGYEHYTGLRDMPIEPCFDGYVQLSLIVRDGKRSAYMDMCLEGAPESEDGQLDIDGFVEITHCPMCGRNLIADGRCD